MTSPEKENSIEVQAPDTLLIELARSKTCTVSLAEPMRSVAGIAPLHDPVMFATARVVGWG